MKTAEEIIKKNIPSGIVNIKGKGDGKPQYKAEIAIIKKCMEEYLQQYAASHPSPVMSAEKVCRWVKASERLPNVGTIVLVKYFDTYQELYYKNNGWFVKGTNLVAYSEHFSLQLEWQEVLSPAPPANDGWVSGSLPGWAAELLTEVRFRLLVDIDTDGEPRSSVAELLEMWDKVNKALDIKTIGVTPPPRNNNNLK